MRSGLRSCPYFVLSHWRSRVVSQFPLHVRGRTQYRSLNAHGLATLKPVREKVAAIPSSYPPPHNHQALSTCPPPARSPPFHPSLLHSLSILPRHQPLTVNHQQPCTAAPKAPLCQRGPPPLPHITSTIVTSFLSLVPWGAGGQGDGAGAGGGLRGSSPGMLLEGLPQGLNPSPPYSSRMRLT